MVGGSYTSVVGDRCALDALASGVNRVQAHMAGAKYSSSDFDDRNISKSIFTLLIISARSTSIRKPTFV